MAAPNGRLHSILEHGDDGALQNKVLLTYDEQGRMSEMITLSSDGNLLARTSFEYDSVNRKVEEQLYIGGLGRRTIFHYNDRHLVIEKSSYAGTASYKTDVSGDVWFTTGAWAAGELMGVVVYEYDEQDRLTGELSYGGDGKIISAQVYHYGDNEPNYTESSSFAPNGSMIVKSAQRTEAWDDQGNWTRIVKLTAAPPSWTYRPECVIYRHITYY
jgi:hypothetical protein